MESGAAILDSQAASKTSAFRVSLRSGGKSLHGSYWCKGISEEELVRFYRLAAKLGVNDMSAYFPEQPVRFPGGWNKKTSKVQLIYIWNV